MNLLLAGGGTGGHVYPALALAEAASLADSANRVLFAGSRAGMEAALVPAAGVPFAGLRVRPPRSRAVGRSLVALATGVLSLGEAAALVARFRPDVILATGGIAATPTVLAGWAWRVPVVVLEGNARPGRVNAALARLARAVCVASDAAASRFPGRRTVLTGLPVRREIVAGTRADGLRRFGLDPDRRTVLAIGGSQGAATLNAAVEEAVGRLSGRRDLQILHQVGRGWAGPAEGPEARDVDGVRYVRVPYLGEIGAAYACADIVVSRCGAAAVAEITATGRPAILVPYPFAAEGHQADNAADLVAADAAVLLQDERLNGRVLAAALAAILDTPGRRDAMAARSRALGRPDAASRVLALLAEVAGRTAVQEAHG